METDNGIRQNSNKVEAVAKLQFLQQQPLKTAVLEPIGRKTAKACAKLTEFCNRLGKLI
jgi:hypothetical protein